MYMFLFDYDNYNRYFYVIPHIEAVLCIVGSINPVGRPKPPSVDQLLSQKINLNILIFMPPDKLKHGFS